MQSSLFAVSQVFLFHCLLYCTKSAASLATILRFTSAGKA